MIIYKCRFTGDELLSDAFKPRPVEDDDGNEKTEGEHGEAEDGVDCKGASVAVAGPVREGKGVAILSFGTRLSEVESAAEALSARGIDPTVADARFAKPLDADLILDLARRHEALITIEEGSVGGFGSHVAQLLSDEGVFDTGLRFRSMVLPDTFIDQASPRDMYAIAEMNAEHIEAKVLSVLGVADISKRA